MSSGNAGQHARARAEAAGRPLASAVTAELLARYDQPGPRYTSYPTAVEFHAGIDATRYEGCLANANRRPAAELSIYIHLPFCEQRCLFCGCHVIISPHHDQAAPYLDLLEREIEMLAARLPQRRSFSQLHLGGGTPTYHSPAQLRRLLSHLMRFFRPVAGAELAVEVDPRVTSAAHLDTLSELGFNRLSLGVQDFTPAVQHVIDRVQTVEQTARLIEHARACGFGGINIDLIYGLPLQSLETFERTVDRVIELGADRAAVYSFAFVPWMRAHMKRIAPERLPGRELKFALFGLARERLLTAGYEPIGMDHFARPGDELVRARRDGRLRRNFQGYTVVSADTVVGLGISAIGDVEGVYVQNSKKLSHYRQALAANRLPVERGIARGPDEEVRRAVIQELMCNFGVDIPALERAHRIRFDAYFREALLRLEPYRSEGLVRIDPERIEATAIGELFIRNLARCFDRYWCEKHEHSSQPVFSRTV